MTLGNAKILLLTILDEKNAKADVTSKLPIFFSEGQKEIAQYYPVYKAVEFSAGEAMPLPADFYKAAYVQTQSGTYIDFKINNHMLECKNNDGVKLMYEMIVEDMPSNVTDDFILVTQSEAIMALVYYVAAQLNNNEDNMGVFQSYFAQYQGKLQNLLQQPKIAAARVIAGDENV